MRQNHYKTYSEPLEVHLTWLSDDLYRSPEIRCGVVVPWEIALVNVALMGGYCYEGVIQPLVMTGRLTTYAPKRLADTTLFVQDVLSQDGLLPGKKATKRPFESDFYTHTFATISVTIRIGLMNDGVPPFAKPTCSRRSCSSPYRIWSQVKRLVLNSMQLKPRVSFICGVMSVLC